MKQNNKVDLLKRFWKGETSLAEEDALFTTEKNQKISEVEKVYFHFVNAVRNKTYDREDQIWNAIERKRNHKRKMLLYLTTGIAASILLIVSLFIMVNSFDSKKGNENQLTLNTINKFWSASGIDPNCNHTLYINGCKSSSDFNAVIQVLNPKCIHHINVDNEPVDASNCENQNGIIDVWLKGKLDDVFSVCEGTIYFYQNGEVHSIAIDDECAPNLLVDCDERPLSEIVQLKPQQIKSIELTTNPLKCNGQLDGEFIVLESK